MILVTLPIKTPNPLNGSHGHWSKKAKLRKGQRQAAAYGVLAAMAREFGPGVRLAALTVGKPLMAFKRGVLVTVTRIAPSSGLDVHDGLGASLKACIDGTADALCVDDRDPRVTWKLEQERGPWGVRIRIEPRGET